MPRNFLGSLVFAALALLAPACDVSVTVITPESVEDEDSEAETATPADMEGTAVPTDSETDREIDTDTDSLASTSSSDVDDEETNNTTGTTGDNSADSATSGASDANTSSASGADSANDGGSEGSESTGEPALLPDGEECGSSEECESNLCGLGVCVEPAPKSCVDAPEQCGAGAECVTFDTGASCVVTGMDTQGGEVAINESPMGEIDQTDIDVWEITDLPAGTYTVKLKANAGGELHILAANGAVLADPSIAVLPDDDQTGFVDYTITLDAPQTFITVAVQGMFPGNHPYYFYTVTQ